MKKYTKFTLSLVLGFVLGLSLVIPLVSKADVVAGSTDYSNLTAEEKIVLIAQLQDQLRTLLIQYITELKAQLVDQTAKIDALSTKVDTVISNQTSNQSSGSTQTTPSATITVMETPQLTVSLGSKTCIVNKDDFGTTTPQSFYPLSVNGSYGYALMRNAEDTSGQEWTNPSLPNAYVGIMGDVGSTYGYTFKVYDKKGGSLLGQTSGSITVEGCN